MPFFVHCFEDTSVLSWALLQEMWSYCHCYMIIVAIIIIIVVIISGDRYYHHHLNNDDDGDANNSSNNTNNNIIIIIVIIINILINVITIIMLLLLFYILLLQLGQLLLLLPPLGWQVWGSIPASEERSGGRVIPVTYELALQWLPCQVPGIVRPALGLVGLVSVFCDWVG